MHRNESVPPDSNEWERGLVYTGRPPIPSPLIPGKEYRITAAYKQRITSENPFSDYVNLYARVTRLAEFRLTELKRRSIGQSLETWIAKHGGGSMSAPYNFAMAFVTMALISPGKETQKRQGELTPTPESFLRPGGAILQSPQAGSQSPHPDEIYNEFDMRKCPNGNSSPVVVSYGERVSNCDGLDFAPFVRKAERFTQSYYEFLKRQSGVNNDQPLTIVERQWYCVTSPDLVVVQVHFVA